MKKYFIIYFFLFSSLFAIGRFNMAKDITGLVRLIGHNPFPKISIYSDEEKREYIFDKKFFEEYKQYDNKIITIKATVKKETYTLSDKSAKFTVYTILDSTIIKK